MGWTIQHTALIKFENVKIIARLKIGQEGKYFKIALKVLYGGIVNIASCSLGGAALLVFKLR
jgi:alkylation response protein AidB-like acyl-CoA dehydrogenase